MNAHRARKRFGQHFLSRDDIVSDIVAAIAPREGETLVEIGPRSWRSYRAAIKSARCVTCD